MRFFALLFLVLVGPTLSFAIPPDDAVLRSNVLAILNNADTATLYSINWKYDPFKYWSDYPYEDHFLGSVVLVKKDRQELIQKFKNAINAGADRLGMVGPDNSCSPHHLMRLKSKGVTWNLLLCNRVNTLVIFKAKEEKSVGVLNLSGNLKGTLDNFLLDHFVPVAGPEKN